MGLFSNVLKRVKEGVEPRRGPRSGIGTLTRRPDLEPRGGGFLKRAARNLNQQIGPEPSPMLPIMPPSIPLTPVQARRQELENLGYDAADVQEILERDQVRGLGNVTSNVLPSIPIAPPPVIPQIPQPLPQIPSPLPTPPPPINIGGPPLDISLIPEREILERPIIPPSRGIIGSNPIIESGTGGIGARPDLPQLPRSSLFGGKGMRDDFMFIERLEDPIKDIQPPVIPDTTPPPVVDPVVITPPVAPPPIVTPDPVIEPAPTTPAAVATDVGAVPTTTMPMGAIDPVLLQQATAETLTDPLIRSLYFGTQDSPGFFQQLQQAGANLIGSDVPLQQTAGLTPLELLARQQAVAGIGGFEPFLQQNRDLVNQAIEQSRRAEQLQDPYYTQAEDIYRDTMGSYDPSMTQQFYNPFEDAVVQQTIEDVMKAGDKQDIAARAREISAGAFGGSRARLGAEERRQDLGEGLAKALGQLRQQGFSEAQRTGLSEFARQQQAKRTGAQGLIGIGTGRGSAAGSLAQRLAGFGGELTGLGRTQEQLRSGQRSELAGFGSTGRGIQETGLGRIFEQQVGQQFRPIQTLGQIGSMLPGYQASKTQIDSQYGMPTDPTAAGLGAAFSAYGALAPRQGSS